MKELSLNTFYLKKIKNVTHFSMTTCVSHLAAVTRSTYTPKPLPFQFQFKLQRGATQWGWGKVGSVFTHWESVGWAVTRLFSMSIVQSEDKSGNIEKLTAKGGEVWKESKDEGGKKSGSFEESNFAWFDWAWRIERRGTDKTRLNRPTDRQEWKVASLLQIV